MCLSCAMVEHVNCTMGIQITNLERRVGAHERAGTWELLYYEAYKAESDTRRRERQLKHDAQALTTLKTRIKGSLV